MESFELVRDGDRIRDSSSGQLVPPDSPGMISLVGVSQVDPRLGDEYQAEIPSMKTQSEGLSVDPADHSHLFLTGLPFPVMWINNASTHYVKDVCESRNEEDELAYVRKTRDTTKTIEEDVVLGDEASDPSADYLDAATASQDSQESRSNVIEPITTSKEQSGKSHKIESSYLVPYIATDTWTANEVRGLLLGLLIFGKNFVLLRRFLEKKEMGEVIAFYYGEFYRSDAHHKWSESRKAKGKRIVTGQKLFSGWREQELLSRLLPDMSKERQDTLQKVFRSYAEGRASLEEFVFSMKSIVGFPALVEAVCIEKEKRDLTKLTTSGSGKSKRSLVVPPPSMPTGEAWSSLGTGDIIELLTGGSRLSKNRSNSIFWEAVWPRLLARGWHSEQPKTKSFASSKDPLVFLIPGVADFSSDDLVKGCHYFNSVSDVLSKVVSEPSLLEFEVKYRDGSYNEDDAWTRELESDSDELSNHDHHCYSSENSKFTIVDTSLRHEGKPSIVRALRHLPEEKMISKRTDRSSENGSSQVGCLLDEIKVAATDIPLSNHDHHYYNADNLKLTIVDTSLRREGKSSKVRVLRHLPEEKMIRKRTNPSREKESSHVDCLLDEVKVANCIGGASCRIDQKTPLTAGVTSLRCLGKSSEVTALRCPPIKLKFSKKTLVFSRESECISRDDLRDERQYSIAVPLKNEGASAGKFTHNEEQCYNSADGSNILNCRRKSYQDRAGDRLEKTLKHHFSRRAKSGHSKEASLSKRRRLTACTNAETNRTTEYSTESLNLDRVVLPQILTPIDTIWNCDSQVSHRENPSLIAAPVDDPQPESKKGALLGKCFGIDIACATEECEIKPVDDPQPENAEPPAVSMESRQYSHENDPDISSNTNKLLPESLRTCNFDTTENLQPESNYRRHSIRKRPLTKRLLESLESEFLHLQRSKKRKLESKRRRRSIPSGSAGNESQKDFHHGIFHTRDVTLLDYS